MRKREKQERQKAGENAFPLTEKYAAYKHAHGDYSQGEIDGCRPFVFLYRGYYFGNSFFLSRSFFFHGVLLSWRSLYDMYRFAFYAGVIIISHLLFSFLYLL